MYGSRAFNLFAEIGDDAKAQWRTSNTFELVHEYGALQQSSFEQIAAQVGDAGNGARGIVMINNAEGGHVFNVVNYGGKVFFLDGQSATVWTELPTFSNEVAWFVPTAGF